MGTSRGGPRQRQRQGAPALPPVPAIPTSLLAAADAAAVAPATPAALFALHVLSTARALHDHALQGRQPARLHQRRRREARGALADAGSTPAHQAGQTARLQYTRGTKRALRRLLAHRQRILL